KDILWMSERSGWSQLYLVPQGGGAPRPLTSGEFDVFGIVRVDTIGKWVYYVASPDNPMQRYLYRINYAKRGPVQRITPPGEPGWHNYSLSPSGRYAVHTYSRFGVPPTISLVSLPDNHMLRTLVDNAPLKAKLAGVRLGATEFRHVDIGNGIKLNAAFIKPPNFDSTSRYPVFFYVYGGPGSQTVTDNWGGQNYLWYQMLAQRGYIVASVDNRGTGARGKAWRKIVYKQLGVVEMQDQAAAARAIGRLPFVDSTRIGIWGWSYGGFMTLNVLTQSAVLADGVSEPQSRDLRREYAAASVHAADEVRGGESAGDDDRALGNALTEPYRSGGLFLSRPITTVTLSSPPRSSASWTSR